MKLGLSGNAANLQYMIMNSNTSQHILWENSHFPTPLISPRLISFVMSLLRSKLRELNPLSD